MIRTDVLKILVCPEDQSSLALASSDLIERVNRAIARRAVKNRAERTLEAPLSAGLVRADGNVLYPIVDEIPLMLVDEAIRLDQAGLAS
jgi:uncharacterized protein YbaR (Trm112 family)